MIKWYNEIAKTFKPWCRHIFTPIIMLTSILAIPFAFVILIINYITKILFDYLVKLAKKLFIEQQ